MTNHYYSEHPDTAHGFEQWVFELKDRAFQFVIDSGVFSRETVDYGSHALIDVFDWEKLPGEGKILGVGYGYGPIGLALAFATRRFVEMTGINERAVSLAQGNAKHNQIERADIHRSNTYGAVHEGTYAAVVSNPPIRAGKKVVREILTGTYPRLKKGGTPIIVIQKKQRAPSAQKKMEETSGNIEIVTRNKGCYIVKSVKK